jgi:cytoskeletal protein CcmA (bactofilin family)
MWNRKKDDEPPIRPAPMPAPTQADLSREGIPMSTFPTRRPEEMVARAGAVIGKSLVIHGQLTGREDVTIDGRVEGDVELMENRCTVGAGGHVQGGIKAKEVVVFGSVHGNLEGTERVEIRKNAKVVGDVRSSRIVMEEESFFKGNVDTLKNDAPPKAPIKPQPVVPAPEVQQPLIHTNPEVKR